MTCPRCGRSDARFHRNAARVSGLDSRCADCKSATRKPLTDQQRATLRENHRRWVAGLRTRVMKLYGGQCVCCGEAELAFLVMDHVNGGGSRARGTSTYTEWRRMLREYPSSEYQVLCANCNMAKERKEGCPHQQSVAIHYAGRYVLGWGL